MKTAPLPAARALGWLASERDRFLPAGGTFRGRDVKLISELALLVNSLRRQPLPGSTSQRLAVESLTDTLEAASAVALASPRASATPADVVFHAILGSALDSRGEASARHRRVVTRAIAAGALDHTERVPHLLMEERRVLDWLDVPHSLPSWEALVSASLLGRPLRAARLSEPTAYQLTHDIMFVAGFDPVPTAAMALLHRSNLRTVLSEAMVRFANEQHWDLLGEFLQCWDCLQLPAEDSIPGKAWTELLTQQADNGSFHGPPQYAKAEAGRNGAGEFLRRYHPTLVAVLALAAHDRRGSRPSQPPGIRRWREAPVGSAPRAAIRLDATWLQNLLGTPPQPGKAAAVACGVLVGTRLCAAMDPSLGPSYLATAERTAELLASTEQPAAMPAGLALTAHALLAQRGLAARALTEFTQAARSVLAAHPPQSAIDDVLLSEKRLVLSQQRLGIPPPRVTAAELCVVTRSLPLRATGEELRLAAATAESYTGHGMKGSPLRLSPLSTELADAARQLAAHATRAFSDGDLETACLLVRASHHIVRRSEHTVAELAAEILLHQRSGGGYGLIEIQAPPGESPGSLDADADLRVPVTLGCLWTLAELTTDFRLYRSLAISGAGVAEPVPTPLPATRGSA